VPARVKDSRKHTLISSSREARVEPAAKPNETGEIVIVGFHVVQPNLQLDSLDEKHLPFRNIVEDVDIQNE
jgi:hypothetical protein